jgi:hypothetical protein
LSGFVPVGIDGSFEDFSLRSIFGECPKNKISKKVKLVCTGEKICSGMRRFVSEKAAVLPFVISLQEIDAKSYSKAFFADEEHIMMLGLDSVDTEASTFYSIFLGKDRYGHVSFEHLKGLIGIAAKSDDKVFKKKTNEDIQRKILATGIILPLGQVVVDQYYPKYISNIRIINKTSGFPQIDQFKIR